MTTDTFTVGTSATYTVPAGVSTLQIECWGGGGGGGGGDDTAGSGGGGGGGGYTTKSSIAVTGGTTVVTYTVGASQVGGAEFNNGTAGHATTATITSPSVSMTANGGGAGLKNGNGGSGGTASGGDTNTTGTAGSNRSGANGGAGGAGAGASGSTGGGSGGAANSGNGSAPGGGGGGAQGGQGASGGTGARGQIAFTYTSNANVGTATGVASSAMQAGMVASTTGLATSSFLAGASYHILGTLGAIVKGKAGSIVSATGLATGSFVSNGITQASFTVSGVATGSFVSTGITLASFTVSAAATTSIVGGGVIQSSFAVTGASSSTVLTGATASASGSSTTSIVSDTIAQSSFAVTGTSSATLAMGAIVTASGLATGSFVSNGITQASFAVTGTSSATLAMGAIGTASGSSTTSIVGGGVIQSSFAVTGASSATALMGSTASAVAIASDSFVALPVNPMVGDCEFTATFVLQTFNYATFIVDSIMAVPQVDMPFCVISGNSLFAVAETVVYFNSPTIAATATLEATGTHIVTSTGTATGAATTSVDGMGVLYQTASIVGATTFVANMGIPQQFATISATANVTCNPVYRLKANCHINATGFLSKNIRVLCFNTVSITSTSTMIVDATPIVKATATANGTAIATAESLAIREGTASIVGTSTVTNTAKLLQVRDTAFIQGVATVVVADTHPDIINSSPSIVGVTTITATELVKKNTSAQVKGAVTLTVAPSMGITLLNSSATFQISSSIFCQVYPEVVGLANIAGVATVQIHPSLIRTSVATTTASSTATAQTQKGFVKTCAITGGSTVTCKVGSAGLAIFTIGSTVTPHVVKGLTTTAHVSGASTFTVSTPEDEVKLTSKVQGFANITATYVLTKPNKASFEATSIISVSDEKTKSGMASIIGTAKIAVACVVENLAVAIHATATMTCNPLMKFQGMAQFIGTSRINVEIDETETNIPTIASQLWGWLSPSLDCALYPVDAPIACSLPCVIYMRSDSEIENYLEGPKAYRKTDFTLGILAPTMQEAIDIEEQIRSKCDGFTGMIGKVPVYDCEVNNIYGAPKWLHEGDNSMGVEYTIEVEIYHAQNTSVTDWVYTDEKSLVNQIMEVQSTTFFNADLTNVRPFVHLIRKGMEKENYLGRVSTFNHAKYDVVVCCDTYLAAVNLAEQIRLNLGFYVEHETDSAYWTPDNELAYKVTLELSCIGWYYPVRAEFNGGSSLSINPRLLSFSGFAVDADSETKVYS